MENNRIGIAYSGDQIECGTIEDKILNSIKNNIDPIQIRAKDIQDYIIEDGQISPKKTESLMKLVTQYNGTISVHLPNPVWENGQLIPKNYDIIGVIKELLLPLGINAYTIHPHINRIEFENMSDEEKINALDEMASYFADIANLGVILAIENIPVRDINTLDDISDIKKREKAKKNISYGMTIEEISTILNETRNKLVLKGRTEEEAKLLVGTTFDTAHSLSMTPDELREVEIDNWMSHFHDDVRIFHISPSVDLNNNVINEENTARTIKAIKDSIKKYNISALPFIEAHGSLELMNSLNSFSNELNVEEVRI